MIVMPYSSEIRQTAILAMLLLLFVYVKDWQQVPVCLAGWGLLLGVFAGSTVTGVALGLLVSSAIRSQIAAVTIVPLLILPQMVLAGRLIPLVDFQGAAPLTWACPSRPLNDALSCSLVQGKKIPDFDEIFPKPKLGDLSLRQLGLGVKPTLRQAILAVGGENALRSLTRRIGDLTLSDLGLGEGRIDLSEALRLTGIRHRTWLTALYRVSGSSAGGSSPHRSRISSGEVKSGSMLLPSQS